MLPLLYITRTEISLCTVAHVYLWCTLTVSHTWNRIKGYFTWTLTHRLEQRFTNSSTSVPFIKIWGFVFILACHTISVLCNTHTSNHTGIGILLHNATVSDFDHSRGMAFDACSVMSFFSFSRPFSKDDAKTAGRGTRCPNNPATPRSVLQLGLDTEVLMPMMVD